jgi:hypothetical protein
METTRIIKFEEEETNEEITEQKEEQEIPPKHFTVRFLSKSVDYRYELLWSAS